MCALRLPIPTQHCFVARTKQYIIDMGQTQDDTSHQPAHTAATGPHEVLTPSHHTPGDAGLAALERLDQGLIEFQALIDAKDKQSVPPHFFTPSHSLVTPSHSLVTPLTLLCLQEAGLAGLERLDQGLIEFQALIDAKDKQAVPIKQREVLEYVGEVEAAMVKGFPFEVPKEYADRPLLKVGTGGLVGRGQEGWRGGGRGRVCGAVVWGERGGGGVEWWCGGVGGRAGQRVLEEGGKEGGGQVEAAMVKGFPFEVPKEYADRPLLKVGLGEAGGVGVWECGWVGVEEWARPLLKVGEGEGH